MTLITSDQNFPFDRRRCDNHRDRHQCKVDKSQYFLKITTIETLTFYTTFVSPRFFSFFRFYTSLANKILIDHYIYLRIIRTNVRMYKNEEIRFHELDRSQSSYPREIEFEMTIIKDRKAEVR